MQSSANDQIRREGLGVLSAVPDALISVITFYLDIRTVCKLACCSRCLRVWAYEPCLWMHHALTGHDGPLAYQVPWILSSVYLWYIFNSWTCAAPLMPAVRSGICSATRCTCQQTAFLHGSSTLPAPGSHTLDFTHQVVLTQANWRQTALTLLHQAVLATAASTSSGTTCPVSKQQQLLEHLSAAVSAAAKPLPPLQGFQSDFLYHRWYRSHVDLSGFLPLVNQVPRVHHGTLDAESFTRLYDTPAQPVILTGARSQLHRNLSSSFIPQPGTGTVLCDLDSRCPEAQWTSQSLVIWANCCRYHHPLHTIIWV